MKNIILSLVLLTVASSAYAGRSNTTAIKKLIVRANYVEIWTDNDGSICSNAKGWHLMNTHANFNALYSGFLASKTSNKKVDIVGTGVCDGDYEKVSWAYVAK